MRGTENTGRNFARIKPANLSAMSEGVNFREENIGLYLLRALYCGGAVFADGAPSGRDAKQHAGNIDAVCTTGG